METARDRLAVLAGQLVEDGELNGSMSILLQYFAYPS